MEKVHDKKLRRHYVWNNIVKQQSARRLLRAALWRTKKSQGKVKSDTREEGGMWKKRVGLERETNRAGKKESFL